MQSLTEILARIHRSEEFELRDLETILSEQIASKSGASRGAVAGIPGFGVRRIPLGPEGVDDHLQSSVEWFARLIRQGGHRVFNVTLRRQATSLVLVAEWVRATDGAPPLPVPARASRGSSADPFA
jgi:hypothetical protein